MHHAVVIAKFYEFTFCCHFAGHCQATNQTLVVFLCQEIGKAKEILVIGSCTSVSLQHNQHTCVQSSQKQTKIFLKLFWCDVFAANLFTFLQSSQNEGLVIVVFFPRKDRALLRTFWKHFNTTTSQWISAEKVFRVYQVYTCRSMFLQPRASESLQKKFAEFIRLFIYLLSFRALRQQQKQKQCESQKARFCQQTDM